jgi:hypothetical protein
VFYIKKGLSFNVNVSGHGFQSENVAIQSGTAERFLKPLSLESKSKGFFILFKTKNYR